MQRADCDEEKRRIIRLENLFQAGRTSLDHPAIVEAAVSAAIYENLAGDTPASTLLLRRLHVDMLLEDNRRRY
jgi:hypothetical protein